MSRDASRLRGAISGALTRISASPFTYPAVTLLVGAATYLYALPWLGYFWDDWEVVFLLNSGSQQLFSGYFAFDRPFAWPYQVMYAIARLSPLAWHTGTYLARWGGVLLLYHSMLRVWPAQGRWLRWIGMLLLVYPGFLQQSISAAYNRHFTAFLVFTLSIFLMVLSIRKARFSWPIAVAAWAATFVHLFTIEYFVGLELARPLLIWLLVWRQDSPDRGRAARRTFLIALPYVAILVFYSWWRLAVFPTTIPIANYAGDFKLLQDFDVSWLSGILAVATRALLDLVHATLRVWLSFLLEPDAWTLQAKISVVALGMGALLAFVFMRLGSVAEDKDAPNAQPTKSMVWFGLWAFLVGGLPIWLTSKQLSALGRWDDRFALAPMIPACMLLVCLVAILVRTRWQTPVLGLLLAVSITAQVLVVNKYRLDWMVQNQYYWQLHWRAPKLALGTAIISFEQPAASVPGYDASFAVNTLYDGTTENGSVPYWFFTNDRFLNFELRPDKAISYKDRNLAFKGNTSAAIAIIHQGEDRCLQVLDAAYEGQPFYGADQEQLVALSDTSRISTSEATPPNHDVFGPEPARSWCYFFQKADLARQLGEWDAILELEREARQRGYSSRFGPELIPFIEAHARTGDWRGALELSRQAQSTVSEMEPLLCSTWARLGALGTADESVVQSARQAFTCQRQ